MRPGAVIWAVWGVAVVVGQAGYSNRFDGCYSTGEQEWSFSHWIHTVDSCAWRTSALTGSYLRTTMFADDAIVRLDVLPQPVLESSLNALFAISVPLELVRKNKIGANSEGQICHQSKLLANKVVVMALSCPENDKARACLALARIPQAEATRLMVALADKPALQNIHFEKSCEQDKP